MDKKVVTKESIISKLVELEAELAQLETSLNSSLNELRNEWLKDQEKQLNECNERIIAVEEICDVNHVSLLA